VLFELHVIDCHIFYGEYIGITLSVHNSCKRNSS